MYAFFEIYAEGRMADIGFIYTQQTKTREEHKIIWFISLERPW